ncbi:MAG TPA: hypothetical protein VGV38_15610 [Pyrinomonadaceae bacterium]|nr:hypothetical protein [Pyrinomonadaceae bacterium]
MSKKLSIMPCVALAAALLAGCSDASETHTGTTTHNGNANTTATSTDTTTSTATNTTASAPDNSVVERTAETGGVSIETRTFRDPNSRVERVVVTTRDGKRTARVYYRDRTVRDLPEGKVDEALEATSDALVAAGGTVVDASKAVGSEVADKAEDAGKEVGDKAEDAADATVKGARKVGSEAADKAEDAKDKAAKGAKKAAEGAKKAGGALKDAVTP